MLAHATDPGLRAYYEFRGVQLSYHCGSPLSGPPRQLLHGGARLAAESAVNWGRSLILLAEDLPVSTTGQVAQPPKAVIANQSYAEAVALLRKACEQRSLGQIWQKGKQTSITARFRNLRASPFRCLILSPEVPQGTKLFFRGSVHNLSFRLGTNKYSCSLRVLLRYRNRIVCTVPRELHFHNLRRQQRQPQVLAKQVICDVGADLPRLYPGGFASDPGQASPLVVVDISTGGFRLKVTQTKHALSLDIGERFKQVRLTLPRQDGSLAVSCDAELANILVLEEWTRDEDGLTPTRQRVTYLGFTFTNVDATRADEVQRFVHALTLASPEDLTVA